MAAFLRRIKQCFVFVIILNIFFMSGCSVVMAIKQPDYKDLNVLSRGVSRGRVIAELGTPLLTEEKEGKKTDIFSFKQGYGKGNKAARAFFHAAADVWTLFLWEIIGTPTEAIANGRKIKVEVAYNSQDQVEDIKYIEVK